MATGTLGTSARDYHTRQTVYINSPVLTSGTGGNFLATQSLKIGTIPAGASIRSLLTCTKVADNAGASLVKVGTSNNAADIFASAAGGFATAGLTSSTVIQAAGNVQVAADTDIWVTNNSSAAAATSGQTQFFVEFLVP